MLRVEQILGWNWKLLIFFVHCSDIYCCWDTVWRNSYNLHFKDDIFSIRVVMYSFEESVDSNSQPKCLVLLTVAFIGYLSPTFSHQRPSVQHQGSLMLSVLGGVGVRLKVFDQQTSGKL